MSAPSEVMIDGVRYIPAVEIKNVTLETVRRHLIELHMGRETDAWRWPPEIGAELWIEISEDAPDTSYPDLHPTVDRFFEMLKAKLAADA
jgi:hypothetical protein